MIKPLNVPQALVAKKTSSSSNPVYVVPSGVVEQYVRLNKEANAAEAALQKVKSEVSAHGLKALTEHNCGHEDKVSSVVLRSDKSEETITYTSKNQYSASVETLNEVFGTHADEYFNAVPKGKFDETPFMVDGKFDEALFATFLTKVQRVCSALEIECPLTISTAYVAKPDFHAKRYTFFSVEQNMFISEKIKNTTQVRA